MPERGNLEENLIPQYRFEWEDGRERTTDELPEAEGVNPIVVHEALAQFGKDDEECEVTLTGYET